MADAHTTALSLLAEHTAAASAALAHAPAPDDALPAQPLPALRAALRAVGAAIAARGTPPELGPVVVGVTGCVAPPRSGASLARSRASFL